MNFELKNWSLDYADSISLYANNEKIAINLRNSFPFPYTLKDAKSFILNSLNSEDNQIFKAITFDGEAIGSISIVQKEDVYSKSAEIGYWLSEDFWNKRIMSKAIKLISNLAFEELDIIKIYAEPFSHNLASRRALENAGFELEAILRKSIYKNNQFFDSCIYSLFR